MKEKSLKARENHIILAMRNHLPDKKWWTYKELGEQLAVRSNAISLYTRRLRESEILTTRRLSREMEVALSGKYAEALPPVDGVGKTGFFGPVAASHKREAEEFAKLDNISPATWFYRAVQSYKRRRDEILTKEW